MTSPVRNQYNPDFVTPPGDTLLETIEALGMSQADLAERTGRPKKTINEIIKGKAALTPETALQLERVLGVSASFWNNREQQYRDSLARLAERNSLQAQIQWIDQFPVRDMIKLGWIQKHTEPVEQLGELLRFFGIAAPSLWQIMWQQNAVAFRRSTVFESNPFAVSAWLRRGQIQAQSINGGPYTAESFRRALNEIRTLTASAPEVFQPETERLCAQAGVALVFVPELKGLRVSGATYWHLGRPVIQVSLRHKRDDHLWFSFFHEAGHILLHGKRQIFIEYQEYGDDEQEADANRFAADLLIPPTEYQGFRPRGIHYSEADVIAFAAHLGIAPGIVVGRLQHDRIISNSHLNGLKRRLCWAHELL